MSVLRVLVLDDVTVTWCLVVVRWWSWWWITVAPVTGRLKV